MIYFNVPVLKAQGKAIIERGSLLLHNISNSNNFSSLSPKQNYKFRAMGVIKTVGDYGHGVLVILILLLGIDAHYKTRQLLEL